MQTPGAVLQGIGLGNAIDQSGIVQANQHNQQLAMRQKEITKRDEENQKQKDEMGLNRFEQNVLGDAKDLNTGTPIDPNNISMRADLHNTAAEMYSKHASDMEVAMALAPKVAKLQQYVNAAQTVSAQKKILIANMEKEKEKGWNTEAISKGIDQSIFYGPDGKLKDPRDVNPDVQSAAADFIKNNPELASNDKALNHFIDTYPATTNVQDVTTYDPRGTMNRFKGKITGQNFLTPETDEKGATVMVPKYQEAFDGGNKLHHDFVNKDGSVTNAPVRLLDKKHYDELMNSDAATHVMGLIKQHIAEYKDDEGKPLPLNSPRAELVGRAIMYDYYKNRAKGHIESAGIENKQSPQAINIALKGNLEQQAFDKEAGKLKAMFGLEGDPESLAYKKRMAQLQAEMDAGKWIPKPPVKTPEQQAAEQSADRVTRLGKASDKTTALSIAKKFEGTTLANGAKVTKVDKTSFFNPSSDFYINVEKDGKTEEIKFKDKEKMAEYFKENMTTAEPAATAPATAPAGKPKSVEDVKNKYKVKY